MLIFFKDFYSPSRLRVLTLYLYRIGITNVICRPSVQTVGRPLAENQTRDWQYDARTLDRQTTIPRALLSLVHCVFIFFKIRIRALVLFCIRFIWVEPKVLLSCFHPELKPSSHFCALTRLASQVLNIFPENVNTLHYFSGGLSQVLWESACTTVLFCHSSLLRYIF